MNITASLEHIVFFQMSICAVSEVFGLPTETTGSNKAATHQGKVYMRGQGNTGERVRKSQSFSGKSHSPWIPTKFYHIGVGTDNARSYGDLANIITTNSQSSSKKDLHALVTNNEYLRKRTPPPLSNGECKTFHM